LDEREYVRKNFRKASQKKGREGQGIYDRRRKPRIMKQRGQQKGLADAYARMEREDHAGEAPKALAGDSLQKERNPRKERLSVP